MKSKIGLWLDHREAIIVILTEGGEEIKHITSSLGEYTRYSGCVHAKTPEALKDITAEDHRDRKSGNQLKLYYDAVITAIRDAESIQIFGPGEAKCELETRLEARGLKGRIVEIETADKMTDRQISAKVRAHFLA